MHNLVSWEEGKKGWQDRAAKNTCLFFDNSVVAYSKKDDYMT